MAVKIEIVITTHQGKLMHDVKASGGAVYTANEKQEVMALVQVIKHYLAQQYDLCFHTQEVNQHVH
ncbi:hypothetical protein LGZ99_14030 [Photorhabdus temperata]|uniref:Uncharacterized protein n=2 Tax=Photorhabdus TaxID=29487 RepID=A0AAW6BPY9_9GAMM|nr:MULTISPECIES: hypothetical protein [Photorhabdus]MCT8348285.1 hypothetical protein [Photorhabdus temperata]MDB6374906.1 hypothetical protein [Photorhabdus bodei]NHB89217.1 hypothetical protein [Photorhabdus tasmaniensis]